MHPDLVAVQKLSYERSGFTIKNFQKEAESCEYGASTFEINQQRIKFRVGKITPTKIGHFVTLWKREKGGPILPLDLLDPIDFVVISVRRVKHFGQFVFPKDVLYNQGIISKNGEGGKRAMRLYFPWDNPVSRQAINTQSWQCKYFYALISNK